MSTGQPDRIMRLPEVIARTKLSRSTIYRKLTSRTFPKPLKISERCIGWRESDVVAWIDNPSAAPMGAPRASGRR